MVIILFLIIKKKKHVSPIHTKNNNDNYKDKDISVYISVQYRLFNFSSSWQPGWLWLS